MNRKQRFVPAKQAIASWRSPTPSPPAAEKTPDPLPAPFCLSAGTAGVECAWLPGIGRGMALEAFILAGGRSSRFGSDKARALLDGRPLILRIADAVRPLASSITVIADRADKFADLNLTTVADRLGGLGPLGGLHTALHLARDWALLLSCDLVELRRPWIESLLAARTPEASAVAFRHAHWEPLLALYHTRLAPLVERRLHQGRLGLQGLLDEAGAVALELPADWPAVVQVNTPADLAAHRDARRDDTAPPADAHTRRKRPRTARWRAGRRPGRRP